MTDSTQGTDARTKILLVLSEEQRDEYKADFDAPAFANVEFVYQPSAVRALTQLAKLHPVLVIVGRETSTREGLEFVALLMERYPKFDRKVVILPAKSDSATLTIQERNPQTGQSTSEESDLAGVLKLIESLAPPAPAAS